MVALYRLSLVFPLIFSAVQAIEVDVNNVDSIKSAASTLAGGIVAAYNKYQGPGATPGLFNEDEDKSYYWHLSGLVWNSLIEYSYLTGDGQYNNVITEALVHQIGDLDAFMPANQTKQLGNEEQGIWGLAALTAAETGLKDPEGKKWLDLAVNVFNTQVARWDSETCMGGLRWQIFTFNQGYQWKNTLTNAGFYLLSARLAEVTGNKTYFQWAEDSFSWAKGVGLIDEDWRVYDGVDAKTDCDSHEISLLEWSSPHGMYLEGTALMYNMTDGDPEQWGEALNGLLNTSSIFYKQEGNVLEEPACVWASNTTCNQEQRFFKGVTARSYARAAIAAPSIEKPLREVLRSSAPAAAKTCEGKGEELSCAFQWTENEGEFRRSTEPVSGAGLGEVFDVLEVVQGLLYEKAGSVSNNSSDTPSGSPSGGPSGNPGGTPTGSAQPARDTGAAGRVSVAWAGVGFAALLAAFGML